MKNKCWWSHNFGKWSETGKGTLSNNETKLMVGIWLQQQRVCEDCNFIEIDTQTKYII